LFLVGFFICTQAGDPINGSYKGYQVIRYHLTNESEISFAKSIVDEIESAEVPIFDIWSSTFFVGGSLDIAVPPQYLSQMKRIPLTQTVMHEDLLASLERERQQMAEATGNATADVFFNTYQNYDAFNAYYNKLVGLYPNLNFKRDVFGASSEGRSIFAWRISSKTGTAASKPKIVYNSLQHAREWISGMTMAYVATYLLENYGKIQDVTDLMNFFEWVFIPITNPDGYVYTHVNSNNRLWRKNRQTNQGSTCLGVDTNRNWGYMWNMGGTSNNPCQDTYLGTAAFSSREAKALSDYIVEINKEGRVRAYIDFHSYSQLYMSPYGYSTRLPADDVVQKALMAKGAAAIRAAYNKNYVHGNVYTTIYQASGSAVDWGYGGAAQIMHSYTIELRDTGTYGFVLPVSEIEPQGIEICNAVVSMGKEIRQA